MNLSALSMGLTRPQSGGYAAVRDAAIAAARRNNAALWYAGNSSDLSGFVYQDSTGTTSATGTDPIGLLLDRSYGAGESYGANAFPTGFATGAGPWLAGGAANLVFAGSNVTVTRVSSDYSGVYSSGVVLTAGRYYLVSVNITANAAGREVSLAHQGVANIASRATVGVLTALYRAPSDGRIAVEFTTGALNGESFTATAISVQEAIGNLGPELVSNPGNPFTATTGYTTVTATLSVASGKLRITNTALNGRGIVQITTIIGNTYKIYAMPEYISGGGISSFQLNVSNNSDGSSNYASATGTAAQSAQLIFTATATTTYISLRNGAVDSVADYSSVSTKQLLGFPATQATAANKPTLELQANGYYGMRFDGTNDFLQHSLAAGMTQAHTLIAAYNNTSSAPSRTIATAGAPATSVQQRVSQLRVGGGTVQVFMVNDAGGNTSIQPAGSVLNTPSLASVVSDGSTYELFKADASSGTAAVVALPTTVTVGVIGAKDGASGEPFAGLIWLIAQNLSAMSPADRIAIERFAALLSGATYS